MAATASGQAFFTEDFSSATPNGWTITTDPNGVVEPALQATNPGYDTRADGVAWASRRVADGAFDNVTNVLERTIDTTGQSNVLWALTVSQNGTSWEGSEGLIIEVDSGAGFVEVFSDTGILNNPPILGDSQGGADFDSPVIITGSGVDNGSFDIRISLSSGFVATEADAADFQDFAEIWYLDNFETTTSVTLPLRATVDRLTGEVVVTNPSIGVGGAVSFMGYSFTSDAGTIDPAGALTGDPTGWTSIADTYDVNGSSSTQISGDDWTELTTSAFGDVSEFDFESTAGATLAAGESISLGNIWVANPSEDIDFGYIGSDGAFVAAAVEYINGTAIENGDFDSDGDIDAADWGILRSNLWGEFPDETLTQTYMRGDMNNDRSIGATDFVLFREAFEAANPGSSFAAMVAAPEPGAALLMLAAAGSLGLARRTRFGWALLLLLAVAATPGQSYAVIAAIDSVTLSGGTDGALTSATTSAGVFNGPFAVADIASHYSPETGAAFDPPFPFDAGVAPPDGFLIVPETGQERLVDNDVTSWVAGAPTGGQSGGVLELLWGSSITDTNATDPDFFVFELGGNDTVEVQAILSDGTLGAPIDLTGNWSAAAVADSLTPANNQGIFGSSFAISDLLDAAGSPLSVGSTIRGIMIGEQGAADFSEVYAVGDITPVPDPLTLQVDPLDGDIRIVNGNGSGDAVDFDLYEINSALGELATPGWLTLEQQNLSGFPAGDGTGNGWEAGDLADQDQLGEAYLTGSSSLAPGESVYLGAAVVAGVTQADNLTWSYHLAGAGNIFVDGLIEFTNVDAPEGVDGDYNGDGTVDAADYTVWRDNVGQPEGTLNNDGGIAGPIGQQHYELWRDNYGASPNARGDH